MIEEVRLDDLITLQRGFDISEKEQLQGNIPVISSGGFSSYHNEYKVKGPGVIIGRKGTLGKVFFTHDNYWPHSTALWVKNFHGNDPKFIYYFLQILHLEKFDSGAANPTLNRNHIHSLKVRVPKKEYRSKIASILSAYDELIENNKQRIKLLESMAEEIYKEWFVRLRFPNYENTQFIDGLPIGWEEKTINSIVNIISGYAFKTESFDSNGIYKLVTIKNVQDGFFVTETTDYIYELPKNLKDDCLLRDKDIILSLTGNIGRICMVYGENYLLNQRVAKLKPKEEFMYEFIYLTFRSNFLRTTLENLSNGAAQQNLSPIEMGKLEVLVPSDEILKEFSSFTNSFFDEIVVLNKKNQLLQQTRDLLLPRLISGKLRVEEKLYKIEQNEVNVSMAAELAGDYQ